MSKLQDQEKKIVATVGDGINYAPTLAKPIWELQQDQGQISRERLEKLY